MIKQAFYKSIPVMAGYIVLGTGFGILMHNAGYGVLWTAAMSLFIYAGSMQYVGVNLLTGGASVITTALTTVMVNARHLFYSISMVDLYKDAGKYKPYMIFALTDETYSLLCDGKTPEGADPNAYRFFVSLFNHSYWVTGSILGSLLGAVIPGSHSGPDRASEYACVPGDLWEGQVPDPGYAADHIGPHASSGQRGSPRQRGGKTVRSVILIAVMAVVTILLRFLPFLVFRKETPPYITYLGKVLPPAIIGMLVIYCLKDITPLAQPYGLPELIAAGCVVGAQVLKRNSLISILLGTAVYMVLIRTIL